MKNNPVPPDKSRWGRFDELAEHNLYILRDILNQAQAPGQHSASEKKVGDLLRRLHGRKHHREEGHRSADCRSWSASTRCKTKADVIKQVAYMHQQWHGRRCSPSISSPTCTTRAQTIAYLDQGGLTLPDRDYYIKDDAKSVETREKYLEHVQKMFELAGDTPDVAAAEAKTVLAVETGLAKASMDRTARRDPKTRDHKMTVAEIAAAAPNFDLTAYFAEQRFAQVHHAERRQSRLLQAGEQPARRRAGRRLEDLSALEDHQQLGADC